MEKQKYILTDSTFVRFAIIGVASNVLNFFFYVLIFLISTNIIFSSVAGYLVGVSASYYFGKTWVFKSERALKVAEAIKFLVVYFIGGFGMTLIITWLSESLSIDYKASWIGGAIFAVFNNYLGSKYIVFNKTKTRYFK